MDLYIFLDYPVVVNMAYITIFIIEDINRFHALLWALLMHCTP